MVFLSFRVVSYLMLFVCFGWCRWCGGLRKVVSRLCLGFGSVFGVVW